MVSEPLPDIVEITLTNTDLLSDIAEDVFDDDINPGLLKQYLSQPDNLIMVVRLEGQVIAQARGTILRQPDRAPEFYIDNFGVAPRHHRKGIGTRLYHALEKAASDKGATGICLATEPDNEEANGFYRSLGLQRSKVAFYSTDPE